MDVNKQIRQYSGNLVIFPQLWSWLVLKTICEKSMFKIEYKCGQDRDETIQKGSWCLCQDQNRSWVLQHQAYRQECVVVIFWKGCPFMPGIWGPIRGEAHCRLLYFKRSLLYQWAKTVQFLPLSISRRYQGLISLKTRCQMTSLGPYL